MLSLHIYLIFPSLLLSLSLYTILYLYSLCQVIRISAFISGLAIFNSHLWQSQLCLSGGAHAQSEMALTAYTLPSDSLRACNAISACLSLFLSISLAPCLVPVRIASVLCFICLPGTSHLRFFFIFCRGWPKIMEIY